VTELEAHGGQSGYPSTLIGNHMAEKSEAHSNAVKAYAKKI